MPRRKLPPLPIGRSEERPSLDGLWGERVLRPSGGRSAEGKSRPLSIAREAEAGEAEQQHRPGRGLRRGSEGDAAIAKPSHRAVKQRERFACRQRRVAESVGDLDDLVGIGAVVSRAAGGRGRGPERDGPVGVDLAGQIAQADGRFLRNPSRGRCRCRRSGPPATYSRATKSPSTASISRARRSLSGRSCSRCPHPRHRASTDWRRTGRTG